MQYVSWIKSKLLGSTSKAALVLIPVVAFVLLVIPTASEGVSAVNCPNPPTTPTLNPYPVTYELDAPDCMDFPALDARLTSGEYSTSPQDHANGLDAKAGDEIYVLSYIHNGAADVGVPDEQTRAHDVKISTNVPTTVGTNHTITTSFGGSNTNTVTGNFNIHTPAGMKLEVVPNSGELFNDLGTTVLDSGFNVGNSTYTIDKNNGDPVGDMRACFQHSVFVRFKVRVVPVQQQTDTTLSITKEVRSFPSGSFAKEITVNNGSTVEYRIKVKNTGNTDAINVIATDSFPSGLTFVNGTLNVDHAFNGQLTAGGMTFGNLRPGEEVTITYRATVNQSSGSIINVATADADNTQKVQDTAKVNTSTVINQLVCAPKNRTVNINQTVDFSASGGQGGGFTWSAPGGFPSSGSGSSFSTLYPTPGTFTVTVSNGVLNDSCTVVVNPINNNQLVCAPKNRTILVNESASFTASGGNGSFTWSAPGANPTSGSGSSFATFYNSNGTFTVTVFSGNQSDTCNVVVNSIVNNDLNCVPSNQVVEVDETANFTATGGTGSYSWSAPQGRPSSGSGRNFDTSYDDEGIRTVTVFSGNQSDSCQVRVEDDDDDDNDDDRELRIEKTVRNLSNGSSSFQNSVNAVTGDRVEFRIRVTNTGDTSIRNVEVDDDLPSGLRMVGSFDGDIGTLDEDDVETITFRADVTSNDSGRCLVNTAEVDGDGVDSEEDSASVCISSVQGSTVNLQFNKRAFNDTRSTNAETVTANRGDLITYTLTVTNTGNAAQNSFVIVDDLSGVLAFADMIDLGGGSLSGTTISYPAVTVPAGGSVSRTFRVRIKPSLQSNLTYQLRNTYGNTVTINVGSVLGESIFVAPKTGASGTSAGIFAGLVTAGFVAFRKRQWLSKLIFN